MFKLELSDCSASGKLKHLKLYLISTTKNVRKAEQTKTWFLEKQHWRGFEHCLTTICFKPKCIHKTLKHLEIVVFQKMLPAKHPQTAVLIKNSGVRAVKENKTNWFSKVNSCQKTKQLPPPKVRSYKRQKQTNPES